jgi:hypothetical protein
MPTETITPELVAAPEEQKALLAIVQQNDIPPEAAMSLQTAFTPAFTEARAILQQSRAIVVTDATQRLQIKLAREYRLALKSIRVAADKTRKELKDESQRRGRAIDGFYNILLHLTESEEKRLADQEEFAERQEAARKEALRVKRTEMLTALAIDPALYQLGEMSEETFQQLVEGTKLARAAAIENAKKAEAERIAKEAAEAAERERIRLENERLKKEADEKEAALKVERERVAKEKAEAAAAAKAEREAAEAKLAEERRIAEEKAAAERKRVEAERKAAEEKARIERERLEEESRKEKMRLQAEAEVERKKAAAAQAERARLEAEAKAARDVEAARVAAEEDAKRKAAAAPDKEKLMAFAVAVRGLHTPELSTDAGKAVRNKLSEQIMKFAAWVEKEAAAL